MDERIKEIRERFEMNQRDFAGRINVGQSTLAMFETGDRTPKDIHINRICQEFGVSEEWLRHGTGSMFEKKDEEEALFFELGVALKNNASRKRIISALLKMSEEEGAALEKFVVQIHKEMFGE